MAAKDKERYAKEMKAYEAPAPTSNAPVPTSNGPAPVSNPTPDPAPSADSSPVMPWNIPADPSGDANESFAMEDAAADAAAEEENEDQLAAMDVDPEPSAAAPASTSKTPTATTTTTAPETPTAAAAAPSDPATEKKMTSLSDYIVKTCSGEPSLLAGFIVEFTKSSFNYVSPGGKKLRSRKEVAKYLKLSEGGGASLASGASPSPMAAPEPDEKTTRERKKTPKAAVTPSSTPVEPVDDEMVAKYNAIRDEYLDDLRKNMKR